MILTCPECATRYFVPDGAVGSAGRTVKCSACGARWTAHAEPDLELFVDAEEGALAREALEPAAVEQPVSALPGEVLPKVFREKADTERRVREAMTTGIVWASMAVALMALIGTAVIFRVNVVKLWPASAAAYAGVGLPVNPLGLTIEELRADPALQDSHAALAVSGVIRNIEARPAVAPPLRVVLKNKAGKIVAVKVARPADPDIPAGGVRHFVVTLLDPPTTASELEVGFEPDADGEAAPPAPAAEGGGHAPAPKTLALRGAAEKPHGPVPAAPATAEAHPLPESSPYALPKEGH
ncbi:MAG: DUF3426 domain-containing protein [Pseudomonadota bacterium]